MRFLGLGLVLVGVAATSAQDVHVRVSPGVKTGIEGTTEFPTIQNALDHHPFAEPGDRVFLEIEAGTYHERVIVTQNHQNVTFVGMGKTPEETVITNSLNAKTAGGTFFTEMAEINGGGFEADNLTFENTAGNTGQAVTAAVRAERAVFKRTQVSEGRPEEPGFSPGKSFRRGLFFVCGLHPTEQVGDLPPFHPLECSTCC